VDRGDLATNENYVGSDRTSPVRERSRPERRVRGGRVANPGSAFAVQADVQRRLSCGKVRCHTDEHRLPVEVGQSILEAQPLGLRGEWERIARERWAAAASRENQYQSDSDCAEATGGTGSPPPASPLMRARFLDHTIVRADRR
jgi:hypothetical protein